ncbi:MAG TPA: hypothetical protein VGH33_04540 [Isosphaeraceae bacterium]
MSERRADRRRKDRRAFQPTLGGLEDRFLMAHLGKWGFLYPAGHIQTAFNGQAVDITTQTGESFYISVTNGGTIRAFAMPGDKYGLKLLGTNNQSVVTINPVVDSQVVHTAHTFNTRQTAYTGLINIGSIAVATGQVDDILGYKTAILSGPLIATGTNPIDRLAFYSLAPGANIITGGDVDTMDIWTGITLSGANTGVNIGRDLNFLSTNGDILIGNNANFVIGRDVGLTAQLAKWTGPSSVPSNSLVNGQFATGYDSALIQGSLVIAPGSSFVIGQSIAANFQINGNFTGFSRFSFKNFIQTGTITVQGVATP